MLEEIIQEYLFRSHSLGELGRCDRVVGETGLCLRVNGTIECGVMAYFIDSEMRKRKYRRL